MYYVLQVAPGTEKHTFQIWYHETFMDSVFIQQGI